MNERLHALRPLSHVSMWRMATVPELADTMERLPHWATILRAFQTRRVHCQRNTSTASRLSCTGLFRSNTIFSPVIGSTFNLHQLLGLRRCLDAVVLTEKRRTAMYARVVHSRIEFQWLHPHPPLEMLDEGYVWLPSGEDYAGGYNDRHAVLSRSAADVYFGQRWDAIISGDVMRIDQQLRSGSIHNVLAIQGDYYLRSVLDYNGLEVRRFLAVQALRCCSGPCFTSACYKRVLPTANGLSTLLKAAWLDEPVINHSSTPLMRAATQLTRMAFAADNAEGAARLSTTPSAELIAAKYRDEVEAAIHHALALSLPGARFALRPDGKRLNDTLRWNRRHPDKRIEPPLAVVAIAPAGYAPAWSPSLLALRVAERNHAGGPGVSNLGRRRKTVALSPYVEWG